MNIREIEPKFEEIEERLGRLESTQHSHELEESTGVGEQLSEVSDAEQVDEVPEAPEASPDIDEVPEAPEASPDIDEVPEAPEASAHEERDPTPAQADTDPPIEAEQTEDGNSLRPEGCEDTSPSEETEEEVGVDLSRFLNETESAATSSPVDALDSDLKARIASDVKRYKVAEVINAAMNHPKLRHARELVMKPETGVMEKVQSFRLTDGTFMVPSREVFERVVLETKIDEVEWVKDVTDCEDISLRFNARCIELGLNSCGRVMSWSGGHCFIIAIVRDGDSLGFAFLEPQTDEFLTDAVGEGQYSLDNCLILIN